MIFLSANTIWKNSILFFLISPHFYLSYENENLKACMKVYEKYHHSSCKKLILPLSKGFNISIASYEVQTSIVKLQNFKRGNMCFYHICRSWSTVHTDVNERFNAISQVHLPLWLKQLKKGVQLECLKAWFVFEKQKKI